MKYLVISIIAVCLLASCHSKEKSIAEQTLTAVQENTPGTIPAKEGGWTMRAKMQGKDWVATSFMPPEATGKIIGYYNNESISLPYNRSKMVTGTKIEFGEHNAVDLLTNDDIAIWGGRKGEMEITKADDQWAEGVFHFTGSSSRSDKTIEVTDGFFRISLAQHP